MLLSLLWKSCFLAKTHYYHSGTVILPHSVEMGKKGKRMVGWWQGEKENSCLWSKSVNSLFFSHLKNSVITQVCLYLELDVWDMGISYRKEYTHTCTHTHICTHIFFNLCFGHGCSVVKPSGNLKASSVFISGHQSTSEPGWHCLPSLKSWGEGLSSGNSCWWLAAPFTLLSFK